MRMPSRCPACAGLLQTTTLVCTQCATQVSGAFRACPLCSLEDEDRGLLELFLRVRGNAKAIQRALGISYPTVRARLDRLWSHLDLSTPAVEPAEPSAMAILSALREGHIGVAEAARLLRHRGHPPAGSA